MVILKNGEIEFEDEADLNDMPALEDALIGDEKFGAEHGEMLVLVTR